MSSPDFGPFDNVTRIHPIQQPPSDGPTDGSLNTEHTSRHKFPKDVGYRIPDGPVKPTVNSTPRPTGPDIPPALGYFPGSAFRKPHGEEYNTLPEHTAVPERAPKAPDDLDGRLGPEKPLGHPEYYKTLAKMDRRGPFAAHPAIAHPVDAASRTAPVELVKDIAHVTAATAKLVTPEGRQAAKAYVAKTTGEFRGSFQAGKRTTAEKARGAYVAAVEKSTALKDDYLGTVDEETGEITKGVIATTAADYRHNLATGENRDGDSTDARKLTAILGSVGTVGAVAAGLLIHSKAHENDPVIADTHSETAAVAAVIPGNEDAKAKACEPATGENTFLCDTPSGRLTVNVFDSSTEVSAVARGNDLKSDVGLKGVAARESLAPGAVMEVDVKNRQTDAEAYNVYVKKEAPEGPQDYSVSVSDPVPGAETTQADNDGYGCEAPC